MLVGMLYRLEWALRAPIDARGRPEGIAKTKVGRTWRSWWTDGRWDRSPENVQLRVL